MQTDHPVESLGWTAGSEPLPMGAIVVTSYRANAEWRPRRLSGGEGAMALLANAVPARERPAQVMRVISRAAKGAIVLESDRGEADGVAPLLLAELDYVGARLAVAAVGAYRCLGSAPDAAGTAPWRARCANRAERDDHADRDRQQVGPVAEPGARVAGAQRVGDQEEEPEVDQRAGAGEDLARGGASARPDEQEQHHERDQRRRSLRARWLALPSCQTYGLNVTSEDPRRQVGDDRRAGREVDPLERKVRVVGRVRVLRLLDVLSPGSRRRMPRARPESVIATNRTTTAIRPSELNSFWRAVLNAGVQGDRGPGGDQEPAGVGPGGDRRPGSRRR